MSRTEPTRDLFPPQSNVQTLAVLLAALTGLVHLYLVYEERAEPIEALVFLGAALGFFLGIYLLLRFPSSRLLYIAGVVFTGVQIPLWILGGMESFALGVVDKLVQVALIATLLYLYAKADTASTRATTT